MNSETGAWVEAFAPACVGNVAVGFDILGHTIEGPGDRVRARRASEPGVRIGAIGGCVTNLPRDGRNTASAAVESLRAASDPGGGYELEIDKGIPLAAGMAGSAASAVAAVVAVNALLEKPLAAASLLEHAMAGETVASGARNLDNIAPLLLGGLVLAAEGRMLRIEVPDTWRCVLLRPHCQMLTRVARERLLAPVMLADCVRQSGRLALVLCGCQRGDADLVRAGLEDALVEPRRADLVPGFAETKAAALAHHAMGSSFSGAGPAIFAWFPDDASARRGGDAMRQALAASADLSSDLWISPINGPAAHLLK